jgi:hypothetical protein
MNLATLRVNYCMRLLPSRIVAIDTVKSAESLQLVARWLSLMLMFCFQPECFCHGLHFPCYLQL